MAHRFWGELRAIFREEASLTELLDPSKAGARIHVYLLLLREMVRSIRSDQAFTLASALAYKTLVATVPVLAISFSMVALLDQGGGAESTYSEEFLQSLLNRIPRFAGREDFIDSIRTVADQARLILGISFPVLFFTAFSLFSSVESAFNMIWQVTERRPIISRLGAFFSTMLVVPILMTLSVYLTAHLVHAAERLEQGLPIISTSAPEGPGTANGAPAPERPAGPDAERLDAAAPGTESAPSASIPDPSRTAEPDPGDGSGGGVLRGMVLVVSSTLMTVLAMVALYYLVPYTPVQLRAALVGGILCGVGLEVCKYGFQSFAVMVGENYTKIYGPLLALPFVLLWVYLVWVLILVGAEVAFVSQNFRDLAARAEMEKRGIRSRLYVAVRTVLTASDLFHRGENPEKLIDRVSAEVRLPPYMIREVVLTLVRRGVLRRTVPDEDAYVPGRDIHALTVEDAVAAASGDSLDVPDEPEDGAQRYLDALFARARTAQAEVLGTLSFAELVEATGYRQDNEPTEWAELSASPAPEESDTESPDEEAGDDDAFHREKGTDDHGSG
ncbi:MAG: YihY/virulence factor BrkB family protein [Planctomycetota bacterium]